jgi:hypothetical protein
MKPRTEISKTINKSKIVLVCLQEWMPKNRSNLFYPLTARIWTLEEDDMG